MKKNLRKSLWLIKEVGYYDTLNKLNLMLIFDNFIESIKYVRSESILNNMSTLDIELYSKFITEILIMQKMEFTSENKYFQEIMGYFDEEFISSDGFILILEEIFKTKKLCSSSILNLYMLETEKNRQEIFNIIINYEANGNRKNLTGKKIYQSLNIKRRDHFFFLDIYNSFNEDEKNSLKNDFAIPKFKEVIKGFEYFKNENRKDYEKIFSIIDESSVVLSEEDVLDVLVFLGEDYLNDHLKTLMSTKLNVIELRTNLNIDKTNIFKSNISPYKIQKMLLNILSIKIEITEDMIKNKIKLSHFNDESILLLEDYCIITPVNDIINNIINNKMYRIQNEEFCLTKESLEFLKMNYSF